MTAAWTIPLLTLALMLAAPGCLLEAPLEGDDTKDTVSEGLGGEPLIGCMTHGECPGDMRCAFEAGTCGEIGGACRPAGVEGVSADCSLGAICGCDGVTYPSACDAWSAGVSVWFDGSCDAPASDPPSDPDPGDGSCGGVSCGGGEFCFSDDGTCGSSAGACRPAEGVCTGPAQPVCGCDGQSYDSFCDAVASGASIAHDGPC